MPTVGCAVDPTVASPLPIWVEAGAATAPVPIPEEPGPGDPDTTFVRPLFAEGLRVQALLVDAVTREPVDEIDTAVVEDFDEDVDFLQVSSAKVTASLWDRTLPELVATDTEAGPDGIDVSMWDPKMHGLSVGVNGETSWIGLFRQPLDHGPERMLLPARSPSVLFTEDTLGRVEQLDLYGGWGNFEHFAVGSTPPGMSVPSGCTAVVVWDAVRGKKSLEVTGPFSSWVQCPKVGLAGDANVRRSAEGSAFGRWPEAFAVGQQTILTFTQRADSLTPSNVDATLNKGGTRPDSGTRWSEDPVSSGCSMSESVITHHTWNELRCHPDGVRYDIVRLQQGVLTGFLADTDGARFVERILRDAVSRSTGGYPYGCTTRIESLVGSGEFTQVWNHNGMHSMRDVLSAAMDRDGGAEAYWNPSNVVVIRGSLGQVRTDIVLDNLTTIESTWAIDPGAKIDDFVVLTGRGSGTSLLTSTVSQPRFPLQHRITRIVRAPNNRNLNAVDAWTARHARVGARQQASGTSLVDWWMAKEIAKGDVVNTALSAGRHGWWEPVRILNKRWMPTRRQCLLTWGAVDA